MARQGVRRKTTNPVAMNLRQARAAKGLTFEQLAREVDVTLRTVVRWEHGEATPRYSDLQRLATVLDRTPDWFYRDGREAA